MAGQAEVTEFSKWEHFPRRYNEEGCAVMADQLYLSYWLRGFTEHNMLRHFEIVLRRFPFSALRPQATLTVRAIDLTEPPLLEREFAGAVPVGDLMEAMKWFRNPDASYEVETCWDLWAYHEGWKLESSRVTVCCYAPRFNSERGEQVRIECGLESRFLPPGDSAAGLAPVRHNIRSLLHLVEDLDRSLPVDHRLLWSEAGENFAERLQAALSHGGGAG